MLVFSIDLAAHTGLRLGDLVRLAWSHVGDKAITIATSKSRHRIKATIPLYDALRDVLANIPKRSPTILTNSPGRPWTANGLGSAFSVAKNAAGLSALHFHDLRGTAATRFYTAGIEPSDIGVIMAGRARTLRRSFGAMSIGAPPHSETQRKENVICKTDRKTVRWMTG